MSVFKIDQNYTAILEPEAMKLIPEISVIDEQELLYVICVMDYDDSPYRKKPFEERRLLACRKFFKGKTPDQVETSKVKMAMEAYKDLVFDIRRETIDKYKRRILSLQKDMLREETPLKMLKDTDAAITFLTERIEKLQHELDTEEREENLKIKGGKKLSYVELWQRKQKAHREFKQSM